jgi:hypothetical protein
MPKMFPQQPVRESLKDFEDAFQAVELEDQDEFLVPAGTSTQRMM